jgi:hypothetical protein
MKSEDVDKGRQEADGDKRRREQHGEVCPFDSVEEDWILQQYELQEAVSFGKGNLGVKDNPRKPAHDHTGKAPTCKRRAHESLAGSYLWLVAFQPIAKLFVFAKDKQQSLIHDMLLWAADELGIATNEFYGFAFQLVASRFTRWDVFLFDECHDLPPKVFLRERPPLRRQEHG